MKYFKVMDPYPAGAIPDCVSTTEHDPFHQRIPHRRTSGAMVSRDAHMYQVPDEFTQISGHPLLRYQTWYIRICMASVYLEDDYGTYLHNMIQEDTEDHTPPVVFGFAR